MHIFPASRRLYAALFVGLVVFLGSWLGTEAASAQAPPPPGPPGTVVDLCTGVAFDQSLTLVANKLGVTHDELRTAMQTTLQGTNAGTLQQVNTGPTAMLCSAEAGTMTPPHRAPPIQSGGSAGQGSGQVTCTGNGTGQPTCTGPGAGNVTCRTEPGTGGRTLVTCTAGEPPSGAGCPAHTVQGGPGNGPTTFTGRSCPGGARMGGGPAAGATPVSGNTSACASSSSAGVGIVTGAAGSTVVRELTGPGYDAVARQLGHGITGEQVRVAFCTVR